MHRLKLSQKLFDNVTFDLDSRYTDINSTWMMKGQQTVVGSLLSYCLSCFVLLQLLTFLGDLNAAKTRKYRTIRENRQCVD